MKKHQYRITVEHLADKQGEAVTTAPLQFNVGIHDDVAEVMEKSRERLALGETDHAAFMLGLKLMGEVMMENRDHPLLGEFSLHFRDFMMTLKGKKRSE